MNSIASIIIGPQSELGSQRPITGGRWAEVNRHKTIFHWLRSEVRGQQAEPKLQNMNEAGSPAGDNPEPGREGPCETRGKPPFNEVSVLFPLLSIYTAGYLGLMVADFFLKRSLDMPDGILTIYIALLGAYAADKEIRRWMNKPEPPRKGSIFVYLWTLFALLAFVIHSFCPEFVLPNNLITVCLQVLGIFFGSKASKYVCERRSSSENIAPGREKLVLDIITAKGQVTRQMVMDELGLARSVAGRLLAGMETKGLILRRGETKGSYYVASNKPG